MNERYKDKFGKKEIKVEAASRSCLIDIILFGFVIGATGISVTNRIDQEIYASQLKNEYRKLAQAICVDRNAYYTLAGQAEKKYKTVEECLEKIQNGK